MSPALSKAMGGAQAKQMVPKQAMGGGGKPHQRMTPTQQDIQVDQVPQQLMNPPAPLMSSQQMPTHPSDGQSDIFDN